LFTIALTCTVPASCLGEVAVHFSLELQLTFFALARPK